MTNITSSELERMVDIMIMELIHLDDRAQSMLDDIDGRILEIESVLAMRVVNES
jgi:hypothetical protein